MKRTFTLLLIFITALVATSCADFTAPTAPTLANAPASPQRIDDDSCNPRWTTRRKLSPDGLSITFTNGGCSELSGDRETYVFALFQINDPNDILDQTLVELQELTLRQGETGTMTFKNAPPSCYQTDFYGGMTKAQLLRLGPGPWPAVPGLEDYRSPMAGCVAPKACQSVVTATMSQSLQSISLDVAVTVTFTSGGPVTVNWGDGDPVAIVATSGATTTHKYGRDNLPRSRTLTLTAASGCTTQLTVDIPGANRQPESPPPTACRTFLSGVSVTGGTVTFMILPGGYVELSFISYAISPETTSFLNPPQVFYAGSGHGRFFGPGTHTLTVPLPGGYWQSDLYCGGYKDGENLSEETNREYGPRVVGWDRN